MDENYLLSITPIQTPLPSLISYRVTLFLKYNISFLFRSMMSKHGLKSLFPMEDISVMGLWELLPHLHRIRVSNQRHKYILTQASLS